MEDLLPLLITILIGVVPIFFNSKKSAKNIRKNTREHRDQMEIPLFQELPDSTDNTKPVTASPATEVVPATAPVIAPVTSPAIAPATSPEKREKVRYKVDPKKLVLYSEIMRPKYLE